MHCKRRKRGPRGKGHNYARCGCQQRQEYVGALEYHRAAAFFHQGCVTNKLQSIAQSLLRLQEDGASLQRRAVPDWLEQKALTCQSPRWPPFILPPAPLKIAKAQP